MSRFCHCDIASSCFLSTSIHSGFSCVFLAGAMLALFSIATVKMLIIAIGIGILFWLLHKKIHTLLRPLDLLSLHPVMSICFVIFIGLILRLIFYYVHLGTEIEAFQTGDCLIFLNEAKEMASGSFPEVKSWITIGCYALMIKVFGESLLLLCLLNIVMQITCVILLYLLAHKMFGPLEALLASMAFFWSPNFVTLAFYLYIEHFAYPLVLLQFLLLYHWSEKKNIFYPIIMGLVTLITLWTKPDAGIFLMVIMVFVVLMNAIISYNTLKKTAFGGGIILGIIVLGLFCSYSINVKYHGSHTCLCSEDGLWPQYFGANYANQGKAKIEDKLALYEKYRNETGLPLEFRHNHCPSVLVPYIKNEIHRRWSSMSLKEKIHHIYNKESYSWQIIWNPQYNTELIPKFHTIFKVCIWLAACMSLLILSFRSIAFPNINSIDILRVLPILYLIGMFLCIICVESNFRYTTCANIFYPIFFGHFLCWMKNTYKPQN